MSISYEWMLRKNECFIRMNASSECFLWMNASYEYFYECFLRMNTSYKWVLPMNAFYCNILTLDRTVSEEKQLSKILEYHLDLWTWLNSVQMRTPTGNRWVSNNYITQVPQTAWVSQFESVQFQSQLGTSCRFESQRQTEGLGPQWPTVEQPSQDEKEVLLWSEELCVNMWQSVPVSNSPLTHNQHQSFRNPFENKVWEVYFL